MWFIRVRWGFLWLKIHTNNKTNLHGFHLCFKSLCNVFSPLCLFLISCHASAAISRIKRCSGTILMPTLRRSPLNWTSPKTSPRVETNEYWEVLKQCSFVSECKVKSLQIIQKPSYQELECTIIINLFNTPHSKKYLCPDYYMPIFLFVTKAPCKILCNLDIYFSVYTKHIFL